MSTSWLFAAGICGAAVRAYLLLSSDGSLDGPILGGHGQQILAHGLIPYYEAGAGVAPGVGALPPFNHPPPIAAVIAGLAWLAEATGVPFTLLWRLPFPIFDAGSALLLFRLLASHPQRLAIAAAFWLHPLAWIFSAYQGNSDSGVAFFVLLATRFVAQGRGAAAGAALGLCLWLKVPGVIAAPVLFFALEGARERARFVASGAAITLAGWSPALVVDPSAVIRAVLLYPGLVLQTRTGIPVWGVAFLLPDASSLPFSVRSGYRDAIEALIRWNTWICVVPIVLVAWWRRHERDAPSLARNVGASFAILYGLSHAWAFQYLAWSIPFWLCFPWRIALAASLLSTAYVYGLYAWLTASPFLLGTWDFAGRPDWPYAVRLARDAANLFFFGAALYWIYASLRPPLRDRSQTRLRV